MTAGTCVLPVVKFPSLRTIVWFHLAGCYYIHRKADNDNAVWSWKEKLYWLDYWQGIGPPNLVLDECWCGA